MSKQPSFGRKMNLNFIAEHTVDPESGKTFLGNRGILRANLPMCNTCGEEMSDVKIGRGDLPYRVTQNKKENFDQKKGVFLKIKASKSKRS